jgi:hypothetical protein
MSITECRAAGITFEADEAVAIAQQLIASLREPRAGDEVHPPYGPPSAGNVFLKEDGSVVCGGCVATPAVSEVGIFLDDLLPARSLRVPGGLRYTIARALLNVDVPPFDSLEELSRDLSRHERGNRVAVVRRALARASTHHTIAPMAFVERRRTRASASALRRELREADVRLYLQREALSPTAAVFDLVAAAPAPVPRRARTVSATAACLAAGFSLIAAGEFMHSRHAPIAAPQTAPQVAPQTVAAIRQAPAEAQQPAADADQPRGQRDRVIVAPARGTIAVRQVSSSQVQTSRADSRRASVKRTPRPPAVSVPRRAQSRPASRGVLDRLRLGWLRKPFSSL